MDKKWNKWMVILGLVSIALSFVFAGAVFGFGGGEDSVTPMLFAILFIGGIFIFWLGILSYKNWAMWVNISGAILLTFGTLTVLTIVILSRIDLSGVFS